MKNVHSKSLHKKLYNSPTIQMYFFVYLVAKQFWFPFEDIIFFFLKVNNKNVATKETKLPSEMLDNFASCNAAVFKLNKVLLFFY